MSARNSHRRTESVIYNRLSLTNILIKRKMESTGNWNHPDNLLFPSPYEGGGLGVGTAAPPCKKNLLQKLHLQHEHDDSLQGKGLWCMLRKTFGKPSRRPIFSRRKPRRKQNRDMEHQNPTWERISAQVTQEMKSYGWSSSICAVRSDFRQWRLSSTLDMTLTMTTHKE